MLYLQLGLASIAGFFCLGLGGITLYQAPRLRANRNFAGMLFAVSFWNLSGYAALLSDPTLTLWVFRTLHLSSLLFLPFLVPFMQDLLSIYHRPLQGRLRRGLWAYALLMAPFYFTPYVIEDVTRQGLFGPVVGVLYPLHLVVLVATLGGYGILFLRVYRRSSGLKRNQLKYALLAIAIVAILIVFFGLSFVHAEFFWPYLPLEVAAAYILAYSISEYRLLPFSLWFGRVTLFIGPYLLFAALPFALGTFLREWTLDQVTNHWEALPFFMLLYATPLLLAPGLSSLARSKGEARRLEQLRRQLGIVRTAGERLAREHGATPGQIADKTMRTLKEYYTSAESGQVHRIRFVGIVDSDSVVATSSPDDTDRAALVEFGRHLGALPSSLRANPFGPVELEGLGVGDTSSDIEPRLERVREYLLKTEIEVCCPCVHQDRLYGAILLGQKRGGIFWPEELASLGVVGSQVAIALHNAQLTVQTEQLRELDRYKKELVSNITHELKTPLHIMGSAAATLRKDLKGPPDPARADRYLTMIQNNKTRLMMFVENLLDVAEFQDADVRLELQACDMWDAIGAAADSVRPLAREKGLTLKLLRTGSIDVIVDYDKMLQVFTNLFSNAIKFTQEGSVSVSAEERNASVRIQVTDTGRGIAQEDLGALFDRYFQTGPGRGSGLGLAIVQSHVRAHGGNVFAESNGLGKGSTFTVEVPLEPA